MSAKVKGTSSSIEYAVLNMSSMDLTSVAKMRNGTVSDFEASCAGNGDDFSGNLKEQQKSIKMGREDVDSGVSSLVNTPPLRGIASSLDEQSQVNFTSSNIGRSAIGEVKVIIKKEEDLCSEDDVFQVVLKNHFGITPKHQRDLKCDPESFEIAAARDEILANGLGRQICSGSRDASVHSPNTRCKSNQQPFIRSQKVNTWHDSPVINIRDVRVLLVDLFPKNSCKLTSNASVHHIDSKSCLCVLCVGKLKLAEKMTPFVDEYEDERFNKPKMEPRKRCPKLRAGKWFLCDKCPARFMFPHSLERHALMDHHMYFCLVCQIKFECEADLQLHSKEHIAKKHYTCVFCHFKSEIEAELEVHRKIHVSEKCFSCAKCRVEFVEGYNLLEHIAEHTNKRLLARRDSASELKVKCESKDSSSNHPKKLLSCTYCPAKFRFGCRLRDHLMQHTNEKLFACPHCSAKFVTRPNLACHMVKHSNDTPFACTFCPAKFKRRQTLKNHLMIHNNEKPYACKYCDAKFRENAHLRFHTRIHTNEKPHPCTLCDLKCRTASALKSHMMVHADFKPFSCVVCPREFRKKCTLRVHTKMHTNNGKPVACPQCPARFRQKCQLRIHMMTHTGERPYSCGHCAHRTKTKGELKRHIPIHLEERPYACDQCDVAVKSRRQLWAHKVSHSVQRPFVCDLCPAAFKLRSLLNLHRKCHFSNIVFTCEHCPLKFETKKHVRQHVLTHLERKTHLCPYCSAMFRYRCRLKEHLMRKHSGKRFSCTHCSVKLKSKEGLKYHLNRHLGETQLPNESSAIHMEIEIKEEII